MNTQTLNKRDSLSRSSVSAVRVASDSYEPAAVEEALLKSCEAHEWNAPERGAFGSVVKAGSSVVVKPNLVLHENRGSGGLTELVTNAQLIVAVVDEVLKAKPSQVIVGDAPIQSCDLEALLRSTGLSSWSNDLQRQHREFKGIADFRRTVCAVGNGMRIAQEALRPYDEYVLFNLGTESLLEPISDPRTPFRVTCYDPRLLERTHSPGNHQYLIAKQVIDADVVINLPKLKTHKKAGITNALKNLVGINGNKEYLPHHRLGGADAGGDCYPGKDSIKRVLESVLDRQNTARTRTVEKAMSVVSENLQRLMRFRRDEIGVEGAWSGNETVARMTLDLNRVLLYGLPDGTLSDRVQRRVIHISDAIVAGQGDGPLASEPLQLGLLLASDNPVAMDWIGARLLGYDPQKVPLLALAFDKFRWPIAEFRERDIELIDSDSVGPVLDAYGDSVRHPAGWHTAARAA